jgi:hypothetical protein
MRSDGVSANPGTIQHGRRSASLHGERSAAIVRA